MKPQILLLLVALAAVGTITWFVMQGGEAPPPTGGAEVAGTSDQEERGSPQSARAADAAADQAAAGEGAADSQRTVAPDLRAADVPQQPGMLRARLVDMDGAVRAGVTVSIDTWSFGRDDIDGEAGAPGEDRETVTTDDEGRFAMQVRAGRNGTFSLPDDDLVFAERQRFEGTGVEQDLGDLLVVRGARLAGVVQDEFGKPVAGVGVEAQLGAMGFNVASRATTGEDGAFSVGKLRPGEWTLRTASSRYFPTMEQVEIEAEEQREGLVIVVKPGLTIAGRVIDDRGVGVAGIKVASKRKESLGGVEIERFSGDEAAVTDELGHFVLAGLEGAAVTVRAYGKGHTSVTQAAVPTGTNNLELRVQRLASVSGVLLTTEGDPIAGSRVSWKAQSGRASVARAMAEEFVDVDVVNPGNNVVTAADGTFELVDVKPGTVSVHARGKTHVATKQAGVRVQPAQAVTGIRLRADVGAVARIAVVDADGEPIANASVAVERAPKKSMPGMQYEVRIGGDANDGVVMSGRASLGRATTDEQGVATIMGLPACDAVVKATHESFAPGDGVPLTLPASGTVDGRVELADPCFVDVTAVRYDGSPAAATNVTLQDAHADNGAFVDKGVTDQNGRLRFGPLRAGIYKVALSHGKRERSVGGMMILVGEEEDSIASSVQQVEVLAGRTSAVALTYPLMTRLTGRVVGVDGPVANCIVELADAVDDGGLEGFGGRSTKTDRDGTFVIENVEANNYRVRFGRQEQIVKAEESLIVPPGTPEVHRELTLRTGKVLVRVLSSEDGEPVERAEVRLARGGETSDEQPQPQRIMMVSMIVDGEGGEESSTMTFGQKTVTTDEDGVAEFDDVPVGEYTLEIEHRRHAAKDVRAVRVTERQTTDCGVVELSAAGQIRGQVLGADGKRVAMAMVQYRESGTEQWSGNEVAMSGSYRIQALKPGRYDLRARALSADAGESSEPITVEVTARKTKVQDLTVPK